MKNQNFSGAAPPITSEVVRRMLPGMEEWVKLIGGVNDERERTQEILRALPFFISLY